MKNKLVIYSIFVMMLWGLLFPTVKYSYGIFGIKSVGDIITFAGFRFLICGAVITVFSFVKAPASFKALKCSILPVLASGLFAIVLHYACTYTALKLTDGSKTAILKQLGAVFYICFSSFFFPEDKLNAKKILGLMLGICGILVININSAGISFHIGDLLILAASFCTVFSNVISKKVFVSVQPIVSTGVSQLFGGIVLLAIGLAAGGRISAVVPSNGKQIAVFAVILAASILSYCIWFTVVQKENLSKLFIIKFSEPLFAAIFGWMIAGEDIFKLNYLFAFLFISAGIMLASSKKERFKEAK